jgi:hypothetical protein
VTIHATYVVIPTNDMDFHALNEVVLSSTFLSSPSPSKFDLLNIIVIKEQ